ncbi:nucleoplasmin-like [Spea bombifrons]|uniref:nucleoplasmin-like n=1 Tax=Spea bombifrons TaxID=233779 RepID=UPI00234A8CB6|nr:nucleoplasmin-like [Spea bombifrons]
MSGDELQSFNLSSIHPEEEEKPVSVLWGCKLSKECKKCVFETEDDFLEHLLGLKTICLGPDAKDEMNVISVELKHTQGKPVTIASLRLSVLPMINVDGLELSPPVTFILTSGSGPVYISGQHLTLEDDLQIESEEEEQT